MRPEVITVYSTEAARRISEAANTLKLRQDLLRPQPEACRT